MEAIEHAVENGVKGIEHGNLIDEKTAKMFVFTALHVRVETITSLNELLFPRLVSPLHLVSLGNLVRLMLD